MAEIGDIYWTDESWAQYVTVFFFFRFPVGTDAADIFQVGAKLPNKLDIWILPRHLIFNNSPYNWFSVNLQNTYFIITSIKRGNGGPPTSLLRLHLRHLPPLAYGCTCCWSCWTLFHVRENWKWLCSFTDYYIHKTLIAAHFGSIETSTQHHDESAALVYHFWEHATASLPINWS